MDGLARAARTCKSPLCPLFLLRPVQIQYALDGPPVLAVPLQEMLGVRETPRLAGGRLALVLHLLSPARRPLQVTQDLAGFWRGPYAEVRREMRGRYPKHYWPDDPATATATRFSKRRR